MVKNDLVVKHFTVHGDGGSVTVSETRLRDRCVVSIHNTNFVELARVELTDQQFQALCGLKYEVRVEEARGVGAVGGHIELDLE